MTERLIFDTHAHYLSDAFAPDLEALLDELPTRGVALVLECGVDNDTSRMSAALAESYDYIYAAVGIHPESLIDEEASTQTEFGGDWRAELRAIGALLDHPKVVAVGEAGMDHHWPVPKDAQREMFEAHIRLAMERERPLSIHDREAHAEVYALLKKYKPQKAVLHAYSGSVEDLKWLCAQGVSIGLGGPVTFKNARRALQAAAAVPLENLLLETDCPYMAPAPHRGKRCDSSMIRYIAAAIAEARGMQPEAVLRATLENGRRLFGIG